MFKHIIKSMNHVDVMAVLPLVLFVMVFVGTVLVWFNKNPKTVEDMANIPLEDGTRKEA